MKHNDSRTHFSKDEIAQIEKLVSTLKTLPAEKQKSVRQKIRNIGLYWNDIARGVPYTVENLHLLINQGIITVEGEEISTTSEPKSEGFFSKLASLFKREKTASPTKIATSPTKRNGRKDSDEYYVIGLCNEVLGKTASQQHKFDFLLGDSGKPLPVDAYYENLNLVVEYYERQHTEEVKFFDRKQTVSGVSRGEQRKLYDERRRKELPKHGIKLVIIDYSNFGSSKKLVRNHDQDIKVVKKILTDNGVI